MLERENLFFSMKEVDQEKMEINLIKKELTVYGSYWTVLNHAHLASGCTSLWSL